MSSELPVSKRRTVPIKKLRVLIELAQKYDLREFSVGDVKIVTREKVEAPKQEEATKLTERQLEDYILFGTNGVGDEQ